ncbi:MAG: hypothetical protein ACFFF4_18560, partial [Candidatus Thorarchaeota archaeon]
GVSTIALGISDMTTSLKLQKLIFRRDILPKPANDDLNRALSDVTDFCPPELSINTVHDNHGNMAQIVVGDVHNSWRKASKFSNELAEVKLSRRADIAIVGAGGRGFDGTLYEAIPSLYAGLVATRTGGSIIFVAECPHGPGYEGFVKGISSIDSEKDLQVFGETNFEFGMDRSRFFWRVLESRKLIICSRLRESLVSEKLHAMAVRDPQEGLEIAVKKYGTQSKIIIIENGSNLIPVLE